MNASSESNTARPAKRSRRKAATVDAAADTSRAPIAIPAENGMDETMALRALLAPHVDEASVTLDGSQVQRVHTGAMQLFLMFCRERAAAGRETVWHDPSAPLHAAARVLGITQALHLPRELS